MTRYRVEVVDGVNLCARHVLNLKWLVGPHLVGHLALKVYHPREVLHVYLPLPGR